MNKKIKKTKAPSTYDEYVSALSPKEKARFDKGYQELVLSELILALMKEDVELAENLAKEANLSPTTIKKFQAGPKQNITLQSFLKILNALGYSLVIEKESDEKEKKHKDTLIRLNLSNSSAFTAR